MRVLLAFLFCFVATTAWAGPTPEEAGFDSLVQQYTLTQRELAITKANLAALAATLARERAYWKSYVAGIAKERPGAHKAEQPKGGSHATP